MTAAERLAMYAATCRCCLLAVAMRDCARCVFNVLDEPAVIAEAVAAVYGDAPEDIGDKPQWLQEIDMEPIVWEVPATNA
jgi:hypothetical protein